MKGGEEIPIGVIIVTWIPMGGRVKKKEERGVEIRTRTEAGES